MSVDTKSKRVRAAPVPSAEWPMPGLEWAALQAAFGRLPEGGVGECQNPGGPYPEKDRVGRVSIATTIEFLDYYSKWVREQLDAKQQAEDELVQIKQDLAGAGRVFLRAVGLGAGKVSFDPVSGVQSDA